MTRWLVSVCVGAAVACVAIFSALGHKRVGTPAQSLSRTEQRRDVSNTSEWATVCSPHGSTVFRTAFYDILQPIPVKKMRWDHSSPANFVELAEPVLVARTPAERWTALSTWSPELLSKFKEPLRSVHSRQANLNNSHFVYRRDEDAPFQWDDSRSTKLKFNTTDMTMQSFWDVCAHQPPSAYLYYSGQAIFESTGDFLDDVTPFRQFIVDDGLESGGASEGHSGWIQLNLWMGCAGVTAHLHYDAMENFYTQIQGQKTFLLFSPAYSNCLGLRPQAHPSYRQVHGVDLAVMSDSELTSLRDCATAHGLGPPEQVELGPGDTLYLPPFWFHYVRACTPSVSVNVWTSATALLAADEASAAPLPMELDWTASQFLGALVTFFACIETNLWPEVHHGSTCADIGAIHAMFSTRSHPLSRLVTMRWGPLFQMDAAAQGDEHLQNVCQPFRESVVSGSNDSILSFPTEIAPAEANQATHPKPTVFGSTSQIEHLKIAASRISHIFQRHGLQQGVLRILADNYFDQVFVAMILLRFPVPQEIATETWIFCAMHELLSVFYNLA